MLIKIQNDNTYYIMNVTCLKEVDTPHINTFRLSVEGMIEVFGETHSKGKCKFVLEYSNPQCIKSEVVEFETDMVVMGSEGIFSNLESLEYMGRGELEGHKMVSERLKQAVNHLKGPIEEVWGNTYTKE